MARNKNGTKIREKEPFWKKISGNPDNEKTLKPLWNQRFLTGGSEWTRTTDTPGMNQDTNKKMKALVLVKLQRKALNRWCA